MNKVVDDPQRRRPDISVAMRELNWSPKVKLSEGLDKTIAYFRRELNEINQEEPSQAERRDDESKESIDKRTDL